MWSPPRLYVLCLEMLIPIFEKVGANHDWDNKVNTKGPLDHLAARVGEDLLIQAYQNASSGRPSGFWTDDWKVFLTPKAQNVVLNWDKSLLHFVSPRCQNIRQILVSRWKNFSPLSLSWLPKSVLVLDFDGELFYRGIQSHELDFTSKRKERGWLPESEIILKALHMWRQKSLESSRSISSSCGLAELHLGTAQVTAADLRIILQSVPNLRLLRHYQLVTALNQLHGRQWRSNQPLPKYRLRNLDMDFSHVVRCRMSPEAVLPPDVLQLAVLLCPEATQVRVRFDCSTPHDVLSPLSTMLRSLRELSVVCVTSGERSRLDFTDLIPILEHHGSENLKSLELKVIEELDVHVIMSTCPKLERLVLSGCGNVMPATCPNYNCNSSKSRSALRLKRLKLLFFADGDDFSWDHVVPQCFWKSTLGAGKKDSSHGNRLEGIFLESPRICPTTADDIFSGAKSEKERTAPFPQLQVLSLCRYPEFTLENLATICGLNLSDYGSGSTRNRTNFHTIPLRYVRLSDCEKIGPRQEKYLINMLKNAYPTESVQLCLK